MQKNSEKEPKKAVVAPIKKIEIRFASNGYFITMGDETRVAMTREGALDHIMDFFELASVEAN